MRSYCAPTAPSLPALLPLELHVRDICRGTSKGRVRADLTRARGARRVEGYVRAFPLCTEGFHGCGLMLVVVLCIILLLTLVISCGMLKGAFVRLRRIFRVHAPHAAWLQLKAAAPPEHMVAIGTSSAPEAT